MGLANDASNYARRVATAQQRALSDKLTAQGETFMSEVIIPTFDAFGIGPVVYLGTVQGEHRLWKDQQFGPRYLAKVPHTYHRVQVDDLTFRYVTQGHRHYNGNHREVYGVWLEGPCQRCGKPGSSQKDYVGAFYDTYTRPTEKGRLVSFDPDRAKASFLRFVAAELQRATLCWDCATDLTHECHTCQREWTSESIVNAVNRGA